MERNSDPQTPVGEFVPKLVLAAAAVWVVYFWPSKSGKRCSVVAELHQFFTISVYLAVFINSDDVKKKKRKGGRGEKNRRFEISNPGSGISEIRNSPVVSQLAKCKEFIHRRSVQLSS